ncbi:hypothetical protein I7X12_11060 [Halosimplex litoreum]|uniref:Uncharacterized protein n=1 Tax=Halosimplex litoreum TaxID=1198301 RepID=A0A7T3FV74_9EURY|nr:hypothetical protein [Halosimplex litoreum]QPV61309.1 hypothetical protein I7X12_11060 [Halosimplex litoreum]
MSSTTGYVLGVGQVVQILALSVLLLGQFPLQTDDTALVVAAAAFVVSFGTFVVLYQLQNALFEDGTAEWRN